MKSGPPNHFLYYQGTETEIYLTVKFRKLLNRSKLVSNESYFNKVSNFVLDFIELIEN